MMTTTPATQALLPVTPEDRRQFIVFHSLNGRRYNAEGMAAIDAGKYDDDPKMQAFARRRLAEVGQAHSLPGDVGMRELIFQELRGTMPDGSANRIADKILAALTPSAPSDTVVFAAIKRGGVIHTGRSSHADIEADIGSEDGDVLGYLMSTGGRFVAADNMDIQADIGATPSALSGDAGEEALRQSLAEAYRKGATDVHNYWVNNPGEPPRGDPEFGEAASDYAAAALDLFDSSARFIPSHQGAGE